MVERRAGFVVLRVTGPGAGELFAHEAGGHRWQRIPPNERRGRVHTSTVTVAVLPEPPTTAVWDDMRGDVEVTTTRGSGPGGQHRHKNETAVVLKHVPTGIMVRAESERSQHQNRQLAWMVLTARLAARAEATRHTELNAQRKAHVGTGMRGDKIRTIRCQDGVVTDHVRGTRIALDRYLKGELP